MATENDIVLIYFEDRPLAFARVENILPDSKPDWYHVELLMLQVPLQVVTWILRTAYINGEAFTMNGKKMRLELVQKPQDETASDEETEESETPPEKPVKTGPAKVISMTDLKGRSS